MTTNVIIAIDAQGDLCDIIETQYSRKPKWVRNLIAARQADGETVVEYNGIPDTGRDDRPSPSQLIPIFFQGPL